MVDSHEYFNPEIESNLEDSVSALFECILINIDSPSRQTMQDIVNAAFYLEQSELLPRGVYAQLVGQLENIEPTVIMNLPDAKGFRYKLLGNNIETIEDLTCITEQEFISLNQIGKGAIQFIRKLLEDHHLSFLSEEERLINGLGVFPVNMIIEFNRKGIFSIHQVLFSDVINYFKLVSQKNPKKPISIFDPVDLLIGKRSLLIDDDVLHRWYQEVKTSELFTLFSKKNFIDQDMIIFFTICNLFNVSPKKILENRIPISNIRLQLPQKYVTLFEHILLEVDIKT